MVSGLSRLRVLWLASLLDFYQCTAVDPMTIVSRADWDARTPKERVPTGPALLVVIHHSYIPAACSTRDQCIKNMRSMQDFHMDTRGWSDIGYNFAIGGDAVYEGRGWEVQGAHTKGYNNNSVGIVFIGDYTGQIPSKDMQQRCQDLIQFGVTNLHILPDYILAGHRQLGNTECPGDSLYSVIQGWSHWTSNPTHNTTGNAASLKVPPVSYFSIITMLFVVLYFFDSAYRIE